MALTSAEAGGEARPTDPPPEPAAMEAVGAWQNNKKITALWCINQSRNAFVGVAGIGWKKLANTSDSAIVAMTLLAGHARQTQSPVNYREEADGMLHELYVW